MKYKFLYFFQDRKELEAVLEADNDVEAVLKFYDIYGLAEFGCIREDGHFFTDEKFPKQKQDIILGC